MAYARIDPLPDDVSALASPELRALAHVWQERKGELEGTGAYQEFVRKLQREWAIETGLIERLYTWDRGVTEILIEQGISEAVIAHSGHLNRADAQHAANLIGDQLEIVEGLFSVVKGEEPLGEAFIRALQAKFTVHQETVEAMTPDGKIISVILKKGVYKSLPNNPRRRDGTMHEYCPVELVDEEMRRLVELYRSAEASCPAEVLSAWLHHRFTHIHPFQDGNGRVARALSSLVFLRAGLFPLVIRDAERAGYISALEEADDGDLFGLVALFVRRQKDAILRALGVEQQVRHAGFAEEIISSAISKLKIRQEKSEADALQLNATADALCGCAVERMKELAGALNESLRELTPLGADTYHANAKHACSDSESRHYFHGQIVQVAKHFDYFANFETYRAWARMVITTSSVFELVVSLHGYGRSNSGIIVASVLTFQRVPDEEGGMEVISVKPASSELFQFNYVEDPGSVRGRFHDWLEESIAIGLEDWRRSINA